MPSIRGDHLRLLLVEDTELDAIQTARLLAPTGWDLVHAWTLEEARSLLTSQTFDVVLLDVHLPDAVGSEGVRRLRTFDEDLAIVMLSGHSEGPIAQDCLTQGAQDLLDKSELSYRLLERAIRYAAERQARIRDNRRLQMLDAETELPNRRFFDLATDREVAAALRSGGELALVYIDIDRLKHINARLGYASGDELIVQVAKRLRSRVRTSDLLARVSGDEFAVLLSGMRDARALRGVIEKLARAAGDAVLLGLGEATPTFSIGAALLSDAGDVDGLRAAAGRALEAAKSAGGNRVEIGSSEGESVYRRELELESALGGAEARGELRLAFQPVYALRQQVLLGFEALLRWNYEGREISPAQFIPIAESSGQIDALGSFALRGAARFAASLQPLRYQVNVNLSAAEFRGKDIVAEVVAATRAAGTDPSVLTFEVTESLFSDPRGGAGRQLQHLRQLGAKVAIDDFGTGYSSLSQLRNLPVDILKLDRSFVAQSVKDDASALLARGIIALGLGLQLDVVAEGIETDAERQFVLDSGCETGQGYLLSRPLEVEQATALVHAAARTRGFSLGR